MLILLELKDEPIRQFNLIILDGRYYSSVIQQPSCWLEGATTYYQDGQNLYIGKVLEKS
jgi:hypothetical protein